MGDASVLSSLTKRGVPRCQRELRFTRARSGYELRGAFSTGPQLWGVLALWREKKRPDFGAREVAFVRRVAPHIAAGLRATSALKRSLKP